MGFLQVEHHQVGAGEGAGGQGFFMLHLTVDDGGEVPLLVALHSAPHLGHPRTSGVHNGALALIEELHLVHRGAKGGQDDHIPLLHSRKVLAPLHNRDEQHTHLAQMAVDRGIMDNLVGDPDALFGEMATGLVGHGHGPLHTPAETESLSQVNGETALCKLVVVGADLLDQVALIGIFQGARHLVGAAKATPVVVVGVVERATERLSINGFSHSSTTG